MSGSRYGNCTISQTQYRLLNWAPHLYSSEQAGTIFSSRVFARDLAPFLLCGCPSRNQLRFRICLCSPYRLYGKRPRKHLISPVAASYACSSYAPTPLSVVTPALLVGTTVTEFTDFVVPGYPGIRKVFGIPTPLKLYCPEAREFLDEGHGYPWYPGTLC
eukprot:3596221-Rhodomonas_salina.2